MELTSIRVDGNYDNIQNILHHHHLYHISSSMMVADYASYISEKNQAASRWESIIMSAPNGSLVTPSNVGSVVESVADLVPVLEDSGLNSNNDNTTSNNNNEHLEFSSSTSVSEVNQEDCAICMDTLPKDNTFYLGCGHSFCTDCIRSHFSIQIRDGGMGINTRCPSVDGGACSHIVSREELQELLPAETLKRYDKFVLREKNPNIRECPKCGEMQEKGGTNTNNIMICLYCGQEFCYVHGDAHVGFSCQWFNNKTKVVDGRSRKWKRKFAKKCPGCGAAIEKNQGCNHIACPCGKEFCWVCGHTLTSDNIERHYARWNVMGCPGSQFGNLNNATMTYARAAIIIFSPLVIPLAILTIPFFFLLGRKWYNTLQHDIKEWLAKLLYVAAIIGGTPITLVLSWVFFPIYVAYRLLSIPEEVIATHGLQQQILIFYAFLWVIAWPITMLLSPVLFSLRFREMPFLLLLYPILFFVTPLLCILSDVFSVDVTLFIFTGIDLRPTTF